MKNKRKIIIPVIVIIILLVIGGYFLYKRVASADTAVAYPSWMDSRIVQLAQTKWNENQKNWLNYCSSAVEGSTTYTPATQQEKDLVGQNAKSFTLWTGQTDNNGYTNFADTDFYVDRFKVVIAPIKFERDSSGMNYKAKFKYAIGNPISEPIYLKTTNLRFNFWGIPLGQPTGFMQPGANDVNYAISAEVKLNPGQYVTMETAEFTVGNSVTYSTLSLATGIYDRNPDGSVKWGGSGASPVGCITDPFSIYDLGGEILEQPEFPSWLDATTVNDYQSVWTAGQKKPLSDVVYQFVKQVTPNTSEQQQFGSSAVFFDGGNIYSKISTMPAWYKRNYRLAIAPLSVEKQADGSYWVRLRVGLGNPSSQSIQIKDSFLTIAFYKINGDSTAYSGYASLKFDDGNPTTLSPGQYITKDTNIFVVRDPIYYILNYGDTMLRDDGSWDSGASGIFALPNPISLPNLLGTAPVNPSVTPTITSTTTITPTATITAAPPTQTPTSTATPQVSTYSFPKGFSVYGNTKTMSKETFSTAGLYLYKFDGENNKWLLHPGPDSFDATAFYGYYVYNKQDAKSLSIPYDLTVVNLYKVTSGWNMLWSVNDKPKNQLQLEINGQAKTAEQWMSEGKLHNRIFIIENDKTTDPCVYFKLLSDSSSSANCQNGAQNLGSLSKIPAGRAFWVYVNK